MNKKTKDNIVIGTFGRMQEVKDFLPSPKELIFKKEPKTVKVTLSLYQDTVDFFKTQSKRLDASYQQMIRNLLNRYVRQQQH